MFYKWNLSTRKKNQSIYPRLAMNERQILQPQAVLQNNSQCLLLNVLINATRYNFQFVRNENAKNDHAGIKRKTI